MWSLFPKRLLATFKPNHILKYRNCGTQNKKDPSQLLGSAASKFKPFQDKDAEIILDSIENQYQYPNTLQVEPILEDDTFSGLNLDRGLTGVYDIQDLVQVLKRENAQDICVCQVPKEFKYVDYLTVVSGKSVRHMKAIAEFVRKIYKLKMNSKLDHHIPKIEGKNSSEWLALDLGNIALHIFSKNARTKYDVDGLWAVGAEFDLECNKPEDRINQILLSHSELLNEFKPKSNENV